MKSRWSDRDAADSVERYAPRFGEDLALRTYTSRLLGADGDLVLHGGGNTSVKGTRTDVLGKPVGALFVKGSGRDLARIEPEGHPALDLARLRRLRTLPDLADDAMVNELRQGLFDAAAPTPSIETLVHAFLDAKFVDHSHADAILALTNQRHAEELVREALGERVVVLDYIAPGFLLAKATAEALESRPRAEGIVWLRHGLLTWGESARESYERHIDLVTRAERWLEAKGKPRRRAALAEPATSLEAARARWERAAPVLRGALAEATGDSDRPWRPCILLPLIEREVLDFVDRPDARTLAQTPPLTADHLIRTKAFPLWVDDPDLDDLARLREQVARATQRYRENYEAYRARHSARAEGITDPRATDATPRVVLVPGLGAACAGRDARAAGIVRDITAHTLAVKSRIAEIGAYEGLGEPHLFDMEFRPIQLAKVDAVEPPLGGRVAIVTGAAGAIGSGICRVLLEHGAHVAATDLAGERLEELGEELRSEFTDRVLALPLDVTDPGSVAEAFRGVSRAFGGVDLVLANAGAAHVASLASLDLEAFRRLERINTEGTLLVLAEAARHFELQGTGGDIVLVSTKNVFAPGAQFGAYSATKAAAHQIARIASLELAPLDVRVNMVSPDAVFSEGARSSGLWDLVGPDRMKARGLDRAQLEEYYRNRNILKARITATHVANAVLFFATRQTPTTGATMPVDGGLPDATPR